MLSWKLKNREELKACINQNPNALSLKHSFIVTCPDVEKVFYLWFKSMEEKGKIVNGPMLAARCARFENVFDVPFAERLSDEGWIPSFMKA